MKKITNTVLICAALIILAASCRRSSSRPAPQKPLLPIVNAIKMNLGGTDVTTWDPNTHSYSFTPLVNGTIDQLGYRLDNPVDPSYPAQEVFILSLWDANPSSQPLATTGQKTIQKGANVVYFPITPVVAVVMGQTYYVSREFIPTLAAPDNLGGLCVSAVSIFPQSLLGVVTINHSYFTNNPDPRLATPSSQYDYYLPYIDFQIQ